ncbi:MAG: hypothetical protein F4180_02385 [Chloroflexi bacterium]|nr:hypothetical protein [Chloroflexota bacterium]
MAHVFQLVRKSPLSEQVQHRVPVSGSGEDALRQLGIELGEVPAREVVDQVAGPEAELSIRYPHEFLLRSFGLAIAEDRALGLLRVL